MKKVEVFYSFSSPYSYLLCEQAYKLAEDFDIELLWQPFSAKAAGQQIQGTVYPEKISYIVEDSVRMAKEMGLPLVFAEGWPTTEFEPSRVTRGALVASDLGVLMEYNYKVFQHIWGEGKDPNEEKFFNTLCDDLDVDLGEFLTKLSSNDTKERVKGVYKRGRKLGVYDAPTFLIDGEERFVGIDKLPHVRKVLKK